jgi:two-component SAPR family response regulator
MVQILIVEDELIIAEDISNMLQKMGYDVIGIAMDFDEAVTILENNKPDLILLDINLNGKSDGIDLANVINGKCKIPFIYITSYSDASTLERAKNTNPII